MASLASLSKGFDLRAGPKSQLTISVVNFLRRDVTIDNGAANLALALGPSVGVLSRIIIINCNIRGEDSVANTVSSISSRGTRDLPAAGITRVLHKTTPKLRIGLKDTRPNKDSSVLVQKHHSLSNNGSPLCIISKIPVTDVSSIGTGSVTSVRILGSTSSRSVCKTETTGKIVLIAAGEKIRNGIGIGCDKCTTIRAVSEGFRFCGKRR